MIKDLRNDPSIPKTATNLVFLTKANRTSDIESKILNSILNKQPKRADHYWLIHVDILDEPRTMEYKVTTILPGVITRVDFFLGFKVEPRINSLFNHVTTDLARHGGIDMFSSYPSLRQHNVLTDFRYIIIDRLHATDLDFNFREKLIVSLYFVLARIGLSDVRALGFDASNVFIEQMPLGPEGGSPSKLIRRS